VEFTSKLTDSKIMGVNIGAEVTMDEYRELLPSILERNQYQRKGVKSAGKTYDLLKNDLIKGCVIPPIILAVTENYEAELRPLIEAVMVNYADYTSWGQINEIIQRAVGEKELLILDGLQRSLTIDSIFTQLAEDLLEREKLDGFGKQKIRLEIYAGLSKPGILYRMLTLNTGQSPMTLRHQLEILYHDYIDNEDLPDGIRVIRETDDGRARGGTTYKYSDVIDMFYAFTTGSPMPYNRHALVGELRELDFLEGFSNEGDADEMKILLVLHNKLTRLMSEKANDWTPTPEDEGGVARPFGSSVHSVLTRAQPMTGFGAECRRLLKTGSIQDLTEISGFLDQLSFSDDPSKGLNEMIEVLDRISKRAKRIGDAQRLYFQLATRLLLQPESEARFDLSACWLLAEEKYQLLYA